ncbi:MAG TPA: hypothetical protein VMI94_02790 [Bryobacteraceae bacterium]|nr:hypothetical protein [Bryobacteraceae bacterium]
MQISFAKSVLFLPIAALSLGSLAVAGDSVDTTPGTPRYVVLPAKPGTSAVKPATVLPTWNGSFVYNGTTYNYNMVGTAPSSNTSTTVPVFLIPVKIVITASGGGTTTFDPSHVLSNGKTVIQNTVASPIFDSTSTYVQGGVNVGTTQYIDAFQRANFWGTVSTNPNYHVLLGGPTVVPEVTLKPSSRYGKTGKPFGFTAGEVNINYFDAAAQKIISKITAIQPNALPIFLTNNVYLTDFGCCIGGYHSAVGAQAYAHATYVDVPGQFAQDVSALSHEVGEFVDDPLVNIPNGNPVACGILEVGDPLENNPNFGAYPYTVNGFQYNLQDLVTLPYFGAPPSTSVNNWSTFQGEVLAVCQNGG